MSLLTILTILIFISAAFSYLNEKIIKLPGTIGVVTISVGVSIIILIVGKTTNALTNTIILVTEKINFSRILLDIMLGFLLFASSIRFDNKKLNDHRMPVLLLSTIGVVISTFVFGGLLYGVTLLLNINMPLPYCLLFGSLISPTDPITVSSILEKSKVSPSLKTIILGESLFNDGVGLLLFVILLDITKQPWVDLTAGNIAIFALKEVVGGVCIGLLSGYVGYLLIKSIHDFQTIFLISIALVLGIAVVANYFHSSIPLSTVVAGLTLSSKRLDKSNTTNLFMNRIWKLIDEVLNTILFVLIGLQLVVLPFLSNYWLIGLICLFLILISRMISVSISSLLLLQKASFVNISILTWAGLRGGISVAMALSLPNSPYREIILSSCYLIVIFSIIIQGLTVNRVVNSVS